MADFLGADYLLGDPLARTLFHEHAAALPIVDVHNHLDPADVAGDRRWESLTELWLGDDHYKWRAMRGAGFAEPLVTGDADPWDRFQAWAATVPRLIGNPLYVWTHLELRRAFAIDDVLSPATAASVWERANAQLRSTSARQLLARFGVEVLATTDDPSDPLDAHAAHRALGTAPTVVPTFRPDAAHARLDRPDEWCAWAARLATANGAPAVGDLDSLLHALTVARRRLAALGCRASDHGVTTVPDRPRDPAAADRAVRAARSGEVPAVADREAVLLEVLSLAATLATEDDSVFQLHVGPLRNVSPIVFAGVGRDAGADVIGDRRHAEGLARLLGDLERAGVLPRTVLYNSNPADNAAFAALAGAFTRAGVAGLVQWGPPWWFNDHEEGMRAQLDVLGQVGQLANFIGMLTDSRSILSMTRHELFRRVLCAKLADEVARGRLPGDLERLVALVRALSVDNTREFFGFSAR